MFVNVQVGLAFMGKVWSVEVLVIYVLCVACWHVIQCLAEHLRKPTGVEPVV